MRKNIVMRKSALIYVSTKEFYGESNTLFIRSTVHNYSSYNLSIEEEKALSFGLDQHIPHYFKPQKFTHGIRIFLQEYHKRYFALVRG